MVSANLSLDSTTVRSTYTNARFTLILRQDGQSVTVTSLDVKSYKDDERWKEVTEDIESILDATLEKNDVKNLFGMPRDYLEMVEKGEGHGQAQVRLKTDWLGTLQTIAVDIRPK